MPATMCQIAGCVLRPVIARRARIPGVRQLLADLLARFRAFSRSQEQSHTNANGRPREQAERERVTAVLLVAHRHLTTCFLVAHDPPHFLAPTGPDGSIRTNATTMSHN